jgi:hypothetical protein
VDEGRILVSEDGVCFPEPPDEPVDVLFDGERVWSFNPARDSSARHDIGVVPWPAVLRPFLNGRAEVTLRNHVTGETYARRQVGLGDSDAPIRVVDPGGHPLAVDKGGRLQRTFSRTDDSMREFIMDAVESVLADLRERCGLEAFLSYGCLLGAVRDGRLIGHDSDADLSYISRYTHPFDIIRETGAAEREMRRLGWQTVRMSGADFKVWVPLRDGRRVGVDVFGSFYIDGVYYLTGSRSGHLPLSALLPLCTVTLEDRQILAPRDVEAYLEYLYGPGWRVPDPAFKFPMDPSTVRRMDGWLRGPRQHLRHWHTFYKRRLCDAVPSEPTQFARWVAGLLEPGQRIVDAGTGTGRDALWLAEQGHRVVAAYYATVVFPLIRESAETRGVDVTTRALNFNALGPVLVQGAGLAHGEPHHVYARFLLDSLGASARQNFWRFAQMSQRHGGLTFLEFRTDTSAREPTHFPSHYRAYLPPALVIEEIESSGGRVERREVARGLAPLGDEDPEVCRLIVRWRP